MDRDGDICERLYDMALEKAAQKRSDARAQQYDAETGQRLFSPAINAKSWEVVRQEPIEDVLAVQHENRMQRRQRRIEESQVEQQLVRHPPPPPPPTPPRALPHAASPC
jgi:hypothetical protein